MRGTIRFAALAGLLAGMLAGPAHGQNAVVQWKDSQTSPGSKAVTPSTPLPVSGTFSAGGFTPGLTFATLTATGSSASVALPSGATVFFQNTGTTTVSCTLGVGSATATANELIVPASSGVPVVVGSNTFGACIDQTGSTSNLVVLAGGSGQGNAFGGGSSGGGGGGGAITAASGSYASGALSSGSIASGAMVDLGAIADAAATAGSTGTLSAKMRLITTQLDTLNNNVTSAVPAGTNLIGKFGIDQTTPGTTNLVSIGTNGTVNPTTAANWGLGTFGAAIGTVGNVLGLYDGTNLVRAKGDETNGIWVNIKAGAGSGGTALTDEGAFTQGSTNMTPAGCLFTSSVVNLTSGQAGAVRCTNDRQALVSDAALLAAAQASTPAGTNQIGSLVASTPTTPFAAAASDNHTVWKNGAGVAMSVHTSNNSATKNYLRLYDAGTGFNGCGSATGVIFAMEIPPTDSGFSIGLGGGTGIAFTNGLSVCVTSGFGLTDTTAATASAILVNASYR